MGDRRDIRRVSANADGAPREVCTTGQQVLRESGREHDVSTGTVHVIFDEILRALENLDELRAHDAIRRDGLHTEGRRVHLRVREHAKGERFAEMQMQLRDRRGVRKEHVRISDGREVAGDGRDLVVPHAEPEHADKGEAEVGLQVCDLSVRCQRKRVQAHDAVDVCHVRKLGDFRDGPGAVATVEDPWEVLGSDSRELGGVGGGHVLGEGRLGPPSGCHRRHGQAAQQSDQECQRDVPASPPTQRSAEPVAGDAPGAPIHGVPPGVTLGHVSAGRATSRPAHSRV